MPFIKLEKTSTIVTLEKVMKNYDNSHGGNNLLITCSNNSEIEFSPEELDKILETLSRMITNRQTY